MPIYLEGGRILLEGGDIAVHEDCCCEGGGYNNCEEIAEGELNGSTASVQWSGLNFGQRPEYTLCEDCWNQGPPPTGAVIPFSGINTDFFGNLGVEYVTGIDPPDFVPWFCHRIPQAREVFIYGAIAKCPIAGGQWAIRIILNWTGRSGAGTVLRPAADLLVDTFEFGVSYTINDFISVAAGTCWTPGAGDISASVVFTR